MAKPTVEERIAKQEEELKKLQGKLKKDKKAPIGVALPSQQGDTDDDAAKKKLGALSSKNSPKAKAGQAGSAGGRETVQDKTTAADVGEVETDEVEEAIARLDKMDRGMTLAYEVAGKTLGIPDYREFLSMHERDIKTSKEGLNGAINDSPQYYDMPEDYNDTKAKLITMALGIMESIGSGLSGDTGAKIETAGVVNTIAAGYEHMAKSEVETRALQSSIANKNVDIYNKYRGNVQAMRLAYDTAFNTAEIEMSKNRVQNVKNIMAFHSKVITTKKDLLNKQVDARIQDSKGEVAVMQQMSEENIVDAKLGEKAKTREQKRLNANAKERGATSRANQTAYFKQIDANIKIIQAQSVAQKTIDDGTVHPLSVDQIDKNVAYLFKSRGGNTSWNTVGVNKANNSLTDDQKTRLYRGTITYNDDMLSRIFAIAEEGVGEDETKSKNMLLAWDFFRANDILVSPDIIHKFADIDITNGLSYDIVNNMVNISVENSDVVKKAFRDLEAYDRNPLLSRNVEQDVTDGLNKVNRAYIEKGKTPPYTETDIRNARHSIKSAQDELQAKGFGTSQLATEDRVAMAGLSFISEPSDTVKLVENTGFWSGLFSNDATDFGDFADDFGDPDDLKIPVEDK